MSTEHSEKDRKHAQQAKKTKKKELRHDDQTGTHDKGAQKEF